MFLYDIFDGPLSRVYARFLRRKKKIKKKLMKMDFISLHFHFQFSSHQFALPLSSVQVTWVYISSVQKKTQGAQMPSA